MNSDQLADVGWTPEQWSALNNLARELVLSQTNLRPLIPKGPDMPGAYVIQTPDATDGADDELADEFHFNTEVGTLPVIRLRFNFTILAEQLNDQAVVTRLIEEAARRVARAEDAVLMWGWRAQMLTPLPASVPARARTVGGVIARGLVPETLGLANAPWATTTGPTRYVPIDALINGADALRHNGRSGPFNAALAVGYWNALASIHAGANPDGFRRARRVLGSEERSLLGLAPCLEQASATKLKDFGVTLAGDDHCNWGVVFDPSPSIVDLVTIHPPRLSHVQMTDGDLVLRAEEAFFLRIPNWSGLRAVVTCAEELVTC